VSDVGIWTPNGEPLVLAIGGICDFLSTTRSLTNSEGVVNLVRLLGGYTHTSSAQTAFNTDTFNEQNYVAGIEATSGNLMLVLNW
jgi:hypothetical protein